MLQRYDDRNADIRHGVNGELRHRDESRLSPFDSVVQGGDAVWEGLRLYRSSAATLSANRDPKIHHANLLNSILAKIEATAAGADDALTLDRRGFVAETNATHVFAVVGGGLVTPTA